MPSKERSSGKQQGESGGLPEWITFFAGLIVVLLTTILLTYLHFAGDQGPPEIRIEPLVDEVRAAEEGYYLPVAVHNAGGETAEDVQVEVTLDLPDGAPETITFTLRFLLPSETGEVTLLFSGDPRAGEITSTVSFKVP